MNLLHLFSKPSLREFRIPFSDIPKGVKIRNYWRDYKTKKGMEIDVYEEKKGLMFKVELTDKEKVHYEKSADFMAKHDKVPCYTFRCVSCKEIWLFPFVGDKIIVEEKKGITVRNICLVCEARKNEI